VSRVFMRSICIAVCLSFSSIVLGAENLPEQLRFGSITTHDGLTSSSVSKILQDSQGIIWMATQAGLNRYDGTEFTLFEHDPFNPNSLAHNLIQTMYLDDEGVIWLGTYGGLNRFDPRNERFLPYIHDPDESGSLSNNVVVSIIRDSSGSIWVGTMNGLNRLDEESGSFSRYMPNMADNTSLPDKVVRSLELDGDGNLWVGTYGGLCRYRPESDDFEVFRADPQDSRSLPSPYVMTIIRDEQRPGRFWIGTWGGGVSSFDIASGRAETLKTGEKEVYQLLQDRLGRLWIGTWGGGLVLLDPRDGETLHLTSGKDSCLSGLAHDVVYSLFEDASGLIWIGTNGGGINTFADWENGYRFIVNDAENPASLASGKVEAIWEDNDGTIWIGVYSGGLNRYNPFDGTIERYLHNPDDPMSLSNDIVNAIFRDSRGELWVGTNDGLNRYLPESGGFERIRADGSVWTPPENTIFELMEDSEGNLWLGTNSSGAVRYHVREGRYETFDFDPADPGSLSDDLVRTILEDRTGNIWVGTNNGLNLFLPESRTFRRYLHSPDNMKSLSSSNIRRLMQDSSGTLWIATSGGGLNRYHALDDSFTFISRRDGLLSNHIMGLVEKSAGEIWVSTNLGISILNTLGETFQTIDESSGLLSGELSSGLLLDSRDRLYVGGTKGLTRIDSLSEPREGYTPPVVLTDFEVLGQKRTAHTGPDGLFEEIRLQYADNLISFRFAILDYSSPERNQYAYKLEGFDQEWVYAGRQNSVRYTNLNPGSYTLRVIGAGSRGNWNREGLVIPLRIAAPWWRSLPAFGLYLLALAGLATAGLRVLMRRQLAAAEQITRQQTINRILEEKVRQRTAEIQKSRLIAEKATRAKSLFLANMSHEIRTPLNGIFGMHSLLASSKLNRRQREYLEFSTMAAENLNQLVNDLLDFESIESGTLKLHPVNFSLKESLEFVYSLFEQRAGVKGLEFSLAVDTGKAPDLVTGDRTRFVQVLNNIVGNALKYTEKGSVGIELAGLPAVGETGGLYTITVSDTGIGIPAEKIDSIFDNFTQLDEGYDKSARGVGLGLAIVKRLLEAMGGTIRVESRPEEGSRFTVKLKFPEAPSHNEELPAASLATESETGPVAGGVILICEDEAINRLYLSSVLTQRGYSVDTASNGRKALDAAERGDYSLVLMDLGMPEMDGLEATRRIRLLAGCETVPILALTAHTYAEDIQRTRDAGMNDFISKPIDEKLLLEKVRKWTKG
jgi:signal transduction histidine kinase/ligand-binding sensor domain-containing protein/CheY-like chemotaxis protein